MRICSKCGTRNPGEAKYCKRCGKAFTEFEDTYDDDDYPNNGDFAALPKSRRWFGTREAEEDAFSRYASKESSDDDFTTGIDAEIQYGDYCSDCGAENGSRPHIHRPAQAGKKLSGSGKTLLVMSIIMLFVFWPCAIPLFIVLIKSRTAKTAAEAQKTAKKGVTMGVIMFVILAVCVFFYVASSGLFSFV